MSTYDYGHNTPDDTPSGKKQSESEVLSWLLILVSFIMVWPLGLYLLIRKLSDEKSSTNKRQKTTIQADWVNQQTQTKHSTVTKQQAAPNKASFSNRMTKTPSMKKGTRLALKILGVIFLVAGISAVVDNASWMLFSEHIHRWKLLGLMQGCAMTGAGGLMLGKGISMDRALKRYTNYLAILNNAQSMSFRQLSEITGYKEKRVIEDLDRMIEKNYFGPTAYLDLGVGYFFSSRTAAEEAEAKKREEAATPKEAEAGYAKILHDIRRANDAIDDQELSKKIDRLEDVTAQIFRVIEKDPGKERQIRTFLEYYLPTTQKLLNSYVEFEAAGVDGENLRMAKEKIEDTMADIVRGFENQLDSLYAAAAMDIQSDIDVMSNMMKRDCATATRDFKVSTPGASKDADGEENQMGGTAAAVQDTQD